MTSTLNVLIVSGGGFQGLTLIKGLRYSEAVRIIMVDSSHENISKYFVDSFYPVPEIIHKNQFLNSLLHICEREHVRLIFPTTHIELLTLAENVDLFESKNIKIAISNLDFLKVVMNKISLYHFMLQEGFPVLPLLDISSSDLQFPIIGRPCSSWGSKGITVIHSYDEMKKYQLSELKDNFMWQPFLDNFEEFSIDCAINFDGTVSEYSMRHRIKTLGGFAVITENVQDSTIEKMFAELLKVINSKGARGIFNVQVLKTGSEYYFSDFNPRIGTSAVFSYQLGINYPLFICSYFKPDIYIQSYQENMRSKHLRMVRYLEEFWIEKQNTHKIKGIVFDFDDTLINQKLWIFDKLSELWEIYSHDLPNKEEFLFKGMQTVEEGNRSNLFDALSEEFGFKDSLKDVLISKYRKIAPQNCPLFPDVLSTLTGLKRHGFKLALLTDNPPESQKQKIEACNLNDLFDEIIYSRELKCEKPDKTVFWEVAKLLRLPVHSLAMVGDNLYKDIIGSLDAGYRLAFWIVRDGTFFNFEEKLLDKIFTEKYHFIKIGNLKHLVWSLSENKT